MDRVPATGLEAGEGEHYSYVMACRENDGRKNPCGQGGPRLSETATGDPEWAIGQPCEGHSCRGTIIAQACG